MTTITEPDSPNLAMLEEILAALRDLTPNEHPALSQIMGDAARICQTRHAVRAGINLQLQAALTSIRTGRPEDAAEVIERALDIQARWHGATISEDGDTPVTGTPGEPVT